jgi:STE24 endopeptidase
MPYKLLHAACALLVAAMLAPALSAQETGHPTPVADGAREEQTTAVEPARFDVAQATRAYLSSLTPEEKERSDSYFEGGYWLQLWAVLVAVAVAWILLASRLSLRMRNLAERVSRRKPIHTLVYVAEYMVITYVVIFPFTVYRDFLREHQYGLATQSFSAWLSDQLIELSIEAVFLGILGMAVYGVIRRAPRTWWRWASALSVLVLMVIMLITPVYLLPLFNDYKPLEQGPVKEAVLSMARANGVPADEVYWYDASRQTTRIGANVSGFMGTMRISVNDNLLKRGTLADVKAVVGHEIGHYVLGHVYETLVYVGLVLAGGFAFIYWASQRVLAGKGVRWGVRGVGDVAGLPLLMALLSVYLFAMTPVLNTIIRSNEAEADIFGINASCEPDGRARTAMMHAEDRKVDPGPLEEWIFFDHPSARARVHMAMQWKAEHLDQAPAH